MSFTQAVATCLRKYARFDGRATRSEFWWFYLFSALVVWVPLLLWVYTVLVDIVDLHTVETSRNVMIVFVVGVSLALVVPTLAVGCRRLHDTGRTGWYQLLRLAGVIIPCLGLIGEIVLIVFWAQRGDIGRNEYGLPPDPRSDERRATYTEGEAGPPAEHRGFWQKYRDFRSRGFE